jgi:membrane-associated phospholipid phosphatase
VRVLPVLLVGALGLAATLVISWRIALWAYERKASTQRVGADDRSLLRRLRLTLVRGLTPAPAFVLSAGLGLLLVLGISWGLGEFSLLPAVARVDHPILSYFAERRAEWLTPFMTEVTWIGSYQFTIGLGAAVSLWLVVAKRSWMAPLLLAGAWLGILVMQNLLKNQLVVGTVPPDTIALGPAGPFPSGGAARIMGSAAMSAFLIGSAYGKRVGRWAWTTVGLLAFFETYSRIYLARHWVIDIFGGLLLGGLWVAALAFSYRCLSPNGRAPATDGTTVIDGNGYAARGSLTSTSPLPHQ